MLVVRRRIASLGRELARVLDQVGSDETSMPPPLVVMILLPLNENAASSALAPGRPPGVGRTERLGRVLEQEDLVAVADGPQRVVVAALAVEVDGENGPDAAALAPPVGERLVEKLRIHRPGGGVAVDEHRLGAGVADRVRARRERERGADHLVAGADAEDDERQVERGRAARERERVRDVDDLRELALERVDVRPERREPVGRDRLVDELALAAGRMRRGEVDPGHRRRAYRARRPRAGLPAHRSGRALERPDEIARDPAAVEPAGLRGHALAATVQLSIGAG